MNMRVATLAFAFLLIACSQRVPLQSGATILGAAAAEGMRLARRDMHGVGSPRAWCVSNEEHSLAPAPQGLLAENPVSDQVPLHDATTCTYDSTLAEYHAPGGGRAWLLWVTPFENQVHPNSVKVGYWAGSLLAAEWTCVFENQGGQWRASDCKLNWIS